MDTLGHVAQSTHSSDSSPPLPLCFHSQSNPHLFHFWFHNKLATNISSYYTALLPRVFILSNVQSKAKGHTFQVVFFDMSYRK